MWLLSLIFSFHIACTFDSNNNYTESDIEQLRSLKESPIVSDMVEAGKLPPLRERLPDDPLVITPYEEPGIYGGTWHFDVVSRRDVNLVYNITNPSFLRWGRDGIHITPFFCKDYKMSEDGRVWTIYLRKGVKWSDGHPFTSEDVRFWYEDDAMNLDINRTPKIELMVDRQLGKIKIVDDYTFQVIFPECHKGFHKYMTSIVVFYSPSHYLKQFHEKYADKEDLERRMKESGIKKWSELFIKMDRWFQGYHNPDRPTMRPWVISKRTNSPNMFEFVRNPYFWAVDTSGRQLPYLDKIVVNIASNLQVLAMKTISGDFDFQWRRLNFKDYPILKENEKKHNYEVLLWPQDRGSDIALFINYNCTHPVAGPLLRERKFRIALSLAINRDELNLLFYRGIGKSRQATAAEIVPFFVSEYAEKYAQYDKNEASRLLDEIGLSKRDENGFRLDKEENPILLFIETPDVNKVDVLQIVSEYWKSIGLKTELKIVEGSLMIKRTHSAKVMIQARPFGSFDRGTHTRSSYYAPLYGLWKSSNGKQGEEPIPVFKRIAWIDDQLIKSSMHEEIDLYKQLHKIYSENIWIIGLVGEIPAILAKKNYFRNVPKKSLYSYSRGRRLQLTQPEQYWIDPTRK
jgi:peptide/nickel transport system substrate-binding protein